MRIAEEILPSKISDLNRRYSTSYLEELVPHILKLH